MTAGASPGATTTFPVISPWMRVSRADTGRHASNRAASESPNGGTASSASSFQAMRSACAQACVRGTPRKDGRGRGDSVEANSSCDLRSQLPVPDGMAPLEERERRPPVDEQRAALAPDGEREPHASDRNGAHCHIHPVQRFERGVDRLEDEGSAPPRLSATAGEGHRRLARPERGEDFTRRHHDRHRTPGRRVTVDA